MRIKRLMAVVGLSLFGLLGSAWSAEPVGAALCVTCHDEEDLPDMSRSAHGFSADKRAPDCISCHGPSPTHAKKPAGVAERPHPDRMFTKNSTTPANERSAACLTCHNKDAKRALWAGSQHDAADIACNSCHKIHANNDKVLSKATQTDVCYTCHKEQRTQMNRPSHHPVPEGKMSCSDCHNPHGSAGPKLVKRDSINDTCYTCHAEKRGPFVHPHEPVDEDCSNCHNAHGTTVAAMLKARPPLLCQQCHTPHAQTGNGPIFGQSTGDTRAQNSVTIWQGRSCQNCHTQVHGSNNPSTTNPTPQLLMR
jgi:DmsE family decaheme c-type cytochrome